MRIDRDYINYSKDEKAAKLHAKMSSIREDNGEPEKPQRSGYEALAMIRDLKKEGVTAERLEDEFEPPRKKTKTEKTKKNKKRQERTNEDEGV